MSKVIYCRKDSDIPKVKHWAIIGNDTGYYPTYNEYDRQESYNHITYEAYLDKEDWEQAIIKRSNYESISPYSKNPFIAIEVNPAKITTNIHVAVES